MCDVDAVDPSVKVSVDLRPELYADVVRHAVLRSGGQVVADGRAEVRVISEDSEELRDPAAGYLAVAIVPSDGGGPIIVCYADGTTFRLRDLPAFERWLRRGVL